MRKSYLLCTLRKAVVDSRVPTTFFTTHWYRPSSDWRASWMARLPPSTIRIRLLPARFSVWPFFRQDICGSGDPRGAPHSIRATSPCATRVLTGSRRNSSRRTRDRRWKDREYQWEWEVRGWTVGGGGVCPGVRALIDSILITVRCTGEVHFVGLQQQSWSPPVLHIL